MPEDNLSGAIRKIFNVTDWLHSQSMAPLITEAKGGWFDVSTVGLFDKSLLEPGWRRIDYQLHTSWSGYLTQFARKWPQLNIKLGPSRRHSERGIEERIYASIAAPRRVHEELLKRFASPTKQERDAAATPADESRSSLSASANGESISLTANADTEKILQVVDQMNANSLQVTITIDPEGGLQLRGDPSTSIRMEPGRRSLTYRVPITRSRDIESWVAQLRRPGDEWVMRPGDRGHVEFFVRASLSAHQTLLGALTGATPAPATKPRGWRQPSDDAPRADLPFMSLEDQRAADLAYKLLGMELERTAAEEAAAARQLGFPGALRLSGLQSNNTLFTSRGDAVAVGDLLVGLHVWPTDSLEAIRTILSRDDLEQLSPLKFFVLRKRPSGGFGGGGFGASKPNQHDPYRLATGRISIDAKALMAIRAQQHQAGLLETPLPTDLQPPLLDSSADPVELETPDLLDEPVPPPTLDAASPLEDLTPPEDSPTPQPTPAPGLNTVTPPPHSPAISVDSPPLPTPDLVDAPADLKPSVEPPDIDLAPPEIDAGPVADAALPQETDAEIQALQAGIERLQMRVEEANRELTEIEVAAKVAYEEAATDAIVANLVQAELKQDPYLMAYQQQLFQIDMELESLLATNKNKNSGPIQRLQGSKKLIQSQMNEHLMQRTAELQQKYKNMPDDTLQSVMVEKQIRQSAATQRLKSYRKQIEEKERRLLRLVDAKHQNERAATLSTQRNAFATAEASQEKSSTDVSAADSPVYRYDGQTFDQWRSKWRQELNPARRVEAIRALATFAQVGYADQAAEAILDVAGEYEWEGSRVVSTHGGALYDAIKGAFSSRHPPIPASVWLPRVMERYEKEPSAWAPVANVLIGSLRTYDKETREVVLSFARETTSEFQDAAIRSLQETWEGEEDFAKVLANVVELGEVEASRNALHQLVSQLTNEQTALDWRYDEAPPSPAVEAIISALLQSEVAVQDKIRGAIQSLQPPIHAKLSKILLSRFGGVKDRRARIAVIRTWANSVNQLDASQRASVYKLLLDVVEQDGSRGVKIAAAVAAERVASIKRDGLDSNEPLRQLKFAVGVDPEDEENEAYEKLMDEVRREFRALEVHP